jgi:hypothetical protein
VGKRRVTGTKKNRQAPSLNLHTLASLRPWPTISALAKFALREVIFSGFAVMCLPPADQNSVRRTS